MRERIKFPVLDAVVDEYEQYLGTMIGLGTAAVDMVEAEHDYGVDSEQAVSTRETFEAQSKRLIEVGDKFLQAYKLEKERQDGED